MPDDIIVVIYVKGKNMIFNKNSFINLSNKKAECKISLFGGNIISYRPKTEKHDVFWLGNLNKFDKIQAIRGGIPVCWPRFAEETLNNHFPRHGFARLSIWDVQNILVDEEKIEVNLFLKPDAKFNLDVDVSFNIKITDKLECYLETTNNGNKEFRFSEALHAYFYVGNRNDVVIKGLLGHQYHNSLDGKIYTQEKDLEIKGEVDVAFFNHTKDIEIVDNTLNRIITLQKTGSNSTVIWNPNKDLAEMSEGQYKNFICVEPANQGSNFVVLAPKERHKMTMSVGVRKL